jgi:trans-aconitate 2-methyltransferase
MLATARLRLPHVRFEEADLADWKPGTTYDLIFANAVLQWLPNHEALFPRLALLLKVGGCLAAQMPDTLHEPTHALMRMVAAVGPWTTRLVHDRDPRPWYIIAFEDEKPKTHVTYIELPRKSLSIMIRNHTNRLVEDR